MSYLQHHLNYCQTHTTQQSSELTWIHTTQQSTIQSTKRDSPKTQLQQQTHPSNLLECPLVSSWEQEWPKLFQHSIVCVLCGYVCNSAVCVCVCVCVCMACVSENGTRGMADGPKWPFKHASVKTSQKFQRQCFSSLTEMATIILLLGSQSKMRHRICCRKPSFSGNKIDI